MWMQCRRLQYCIALSGTLVVLHVCMWNEMGRGGAMLCRSGGQMVQIFVRDKHKLLLPPNCV